jgi:phosphonoacetaldehyde hydrolase
MNLRERFDLVVFDWAGTMVDFGCQAPVKALVEAFAAEGVAVDTASARQDMGKSKADHVRALLQIPAVATAWRAARGHTADESDVELLMSRLGPLMREYAAEAATLIPGAREAVEGLRALGFKIASSTGYTREMMAPVLVRAASQGYVPDHVVCSGETPAGRPTPLMIYKACAELGVWPLSRVVKVDDAEAGIAEGRAAGAFTVGVAASGNTVGLSLDDWNALGSQERSARLRESDRVLRAAGADLVVASVADLIPALERSLT